MILDLDKICYFGTEPLEARHFRFATVTIRPLGRSAGGVGRHWRLGGTRGLDVLGALLGRVLECRRWLNSGEFSVLCYMLPCCGNRWVFEYRLPLGLPGVIIRVSVVSSFNGWIWVRVGAVCVAPRSQTQCSLCACLVDVSMMDVHGPR